MIQETDINILLNQVNSEEAQKAIKIAYEIADLIIFHSKVRHNGEQMMVPWNDN